MNRTYRKTIIAGNWKMNKTITETSQFARELKKILPKGRWCTIVICPPALCIPAAEKAFRETRVAIGAQNMNANDSGAYTGEISPAMLTGAGCEYVILGHSERRALGETDAQVNEKVRAAIAHGLRPIICVGESIEQREAGLTAEVISLQVRAALVGLTGTKIKKCVIAYEPLWAIGTGLTATPQQAEEVCRGIRSVIRHHTDAKVARAVSILYGGSMNEENAYELLACPDIDGGLIGGASLVPEKFVKVIQAANQPKRTEPEKLDDELPGAPEEIEEEFSV
jgi:triosephosphate isomerase